MIDTILIINYEVNMSKNTDPRKRQNAYFRSTKVERSFDLPSDLSLHLNHTN